MRRTDGMIFPALPASSSPSQLLPNLPALLLLGWLVFFFRICKGLVSICCKFGGAGAEPERFLWGNQVDQHQESGGSSCLG